jgi:O-antigen/teichoic acid export membrane protein
VLRSIFQTFALLLGGRLAGDLFTFALFVAISRRFGQEGVGLYSFAVALTGFAAVLCDFGLYPYTLKELTRPAPGDRYGAVVWARVWLSGLSTLVVCAGPLLPFREPLGMLIVLVGVHQVLAKLVEGTSAVSVAGDRALRGATFEAAFKLLTALAGIGAVLAGLSLTAVLTVVVVAGVVMAAASYAAMVSGFGRPSAPAPAVRRVLREAWPYAAFLLAFQLHSRMDVLALGLLRNTDTAGVYNAAYRVLFLFSFVPHYMGTALLTRAARMYRETPDQLAALYHRTLRLVLLAGLPLTAALALGARLVIHVLYGSRFEPAVPVLRLLSLLVVPVSLTRLLGMLLTSCDHQNARTRLQWLAAGVTAVLMLALIPPFGSAGAAAALVLSESLLAVLYVATLRPALGWPRVHTAARSVDHV